MYYKYYNKQEQLMDELVPVLITGEPRGENSLVPNPKTRREARIEVQQYYDKRRFILNTLEPQEEMIFSMYYGLKDGKFMSRSQISTEFCITTERVSQILARIHRELRGASLIRLCRYLTDAEIGYNDSCKHFSLEELQKLCDKKVEQIKFDRIPKDQKLANYVLNKILHMTVKEIDEGTREVLKSGYFSCSGEDFSYENILELDINRLKENVLQSFIERIHSMGLIFKCEADYQDDWEKECRLGMMSVGIDKIIKRFGIRVPQSKQQLVKETRFEVLTRMPIDELDMTIRSSNALKYAGLDTVEDILKQSEEDLTNIKNLGNKSRYEVIEKIHSLGLELRPKNKTVEEWIKELKIRIEQNFTTHKKNSTISEQKYVKEVEFKALMGTTIDELDMTIRSSNALKYAGLDTVEDILKQSEEDLTKIKNLGNKSRYEVIEKIHSLGLELRPKNKTAEEWLEELETRLVWQNSTTDNQEFTIG